MGKIVLGSVETLCNYLLTKAARVILRTEQKIEMFDNRRDELESWCLYYNLEFLN